MDTGWTVDHILKMKATRFFAMRKGLVDVRSERLGQLCFELCSVVGAANGGEYSKN